jgi:hypothetical protein
VIQLSRGRSFVVVTWILVLASPEVLRAQEVKPEDKPLAATPAEVCNALPRCCKEHVYIFIVNGLDPANIGNLTGLRDHVQQLGFRQTYYGQIFHVPYFKKEIRRIHREDADARFILVGFSVGVNMTNSMAEAVQDEGIRIDALIYLSGNNYVTPLPSRRPANVERVVNILASGPLKYVGERDYAENVRLPDSWHFGSPGSDQTKELVTRELVTSAGLVPVSEPAAGSMPRVGDEPTPRQIKTQRPVKRDEWDFLKPMSRLDEPRPAPASPHEARESVTGVNLSKGG